jgi:lipopolysaccharide/colanic/teichoic acid biosynthesis glycosyltransferase
VITKSRLFQLWLKRAIDISGAVGALLILGPLLLLLALAVKLTSPGPVLFSQLREGWNGRTFRVLKFRTMHADLGDQSGIQQTVANDVRVTAIGRIMRKTNLDELPQLLNVLAGDMSLIGPRPHPLKMRAAGVAYSECVPYYAKRLAMRPGITGWAQCNGLRGPTDLPLPARARIDHDIAYIQNFSLWLDARIVWKTLRQELFGGTGT